MKQAIIYFFNIIQIQADKIIKKNRVPVDKELLTGTRSLSIRNYWQGQSLSIRNYWQGQSLSIRNYWQGQSLSIRNYWQGRSLSITSSNKELLEFIDNQIIEKEKELECPVCLEVACSPIFMCSEQHLICSTCRPKLSNCPECRVVYTGKNRRHRYAEKTAEELERLKIKKGQVRKYHS